MGAALPLPRSPHRKQEPTVCKLSFGKWRNAFEEMLAWHPQPFWHSAWNREEAVKLSCGGEEDALKTKVASCSFVDLWIRGKASSFQGLLETVLLQDRNIFVETNISQRYKIEIGPFFSSSLRFQMRLSLQGLCICI